MGHTVSMVTILTKYFKAVMKWKIKIDKRKHSHLHLPVILKVTILLMLIIAVEQVIIIVLDLYIETLENMRKKLLSKMHTVKIRKCIS